MCFIYLSSVRKSQLNVLFFIPETLFTFFYLLNICWYIFFIRSVSRWHILVTKYLVERFSLLDCMFVLLKIYQRNFYFFILEIVVECILSLNIWSNTSLKSITSCQSPVYAFKQVSGSALYYDKVDCQPFSPSRAIENVPSELAKLNFLGTASLYKYISKWHPTIHRHGSGIRYHRSSSYKTCIVEKLSA